MTLRLKLNRELEADGVKSVVDGRGDVGVAPNILQLLSRELAGVATHRVGWKLRLQRTRVDRGARL